MQTCCHVTTDRIMYACQPRLPRNYISILLNCFPQLRCGGKHNRCIGLCPQAMFLYIYESRLNHGGTLLRRMERVHKQDFSTRDEVHPESCPYNMLHIFVSFFVTRYKRTELYVYSEYYQPTSSMSNTGTYNFVNSELSENLKML